eukprot:s1042_g10.t1
MSWFRTPDGTQVWVPREEILYTLRPAPKDLSTKELTYLSLGSSKPVFQEIFEDETWDGRKKRHARKAVGKERGYLVRVEMDAQARVVSWFKAALQILVRDQVVSKVDPNEAKNVKRRKQRGQHNECHVETLQRCHHGVCGPGFQVRVSSNEAFQEINLFTNHQVLPAESWDQALSEALHRAYGRVFFAQANIRDLEDSAGGPGELGHPVGPEAEKNASFDPHFKDEEADDVAPCRLEEPQASAAPPRPRWGDICDDEVDETEAIPWPATPASDAAAAPAAAAAASESVETPPVADSPAAVRREDARHPTRPSSVQREVPQRVQPKRRPRSSQARDTQKLNAPGRMAGMALSRSPPRSWEMILSSSCHREQPIVDIDDVTLVSWTELGCPNPPRRRFCSHSGRSIFVPCMDQHICVTDVLQPLWLNEVYPSLVDTRGAPVTAKSGAWPKKIHFFGPSGVHVWWISNILNITNLDVYGYAQATGK